jgi:hypothetical protein
MKSKVILFGIIGALVVAGVFLYWKHHPAVPTQALARSAEPSKPATVADPILKDPYGRFAGMSFDALMRNRPKMHQVHGYPPTAPDEIEMWQWWDAIEKVDDSFEWKMPVEFYGRVVDQTETPIAGATIRWIVAVDGGAKKGTLTSAADGGFQIHGLVGKRLEIWVDAAGYNSGERGMGSYEYAAFHEDHFHVPDAAHPVVFHLYKFHGPEPMYLFSLGSDIPVDGTPAWIDVTTGKVEEKGQIAVIVKKDEPVGLYDSSYTLTIRAADGGGFVQTQDELMFQPPDTGYQSELEISTRSGQRRLTQNLRLYLKTPEGKYAALQLSVTQYNKPLAGMSCLIYYNPSGSKNLEYDGKHQLYLSR